MLWEVGRGKIVVLTVSYLADGIFSIPDQLTVTFESPMENEKLYDTTIVK